MQNKFCYQMQNSFFFFRVRLLVVDSCTGYLANNIFHQVKLIACIYKSSLLAKTSDACERIIKKANVKIVFTVNKSTLTFHQLVQPSSIAVLLVAGP